MIIGGDDGEPLLQRTGQTKALNALMGLFPGNIPTSADAGLVIVDGSLVSACLKILPYHNLLLAYDLPRIQFTTPGYAERISTQGYSYIILRFITQGLSHVPCLPGKSFREGEMGEKRVWSNLT